MSTLLIRKPKPQLPWASETLYFQSTDYFASLMREIASAQSRIDMEMYIFQPDELGAMIEAALVAAARRGVQIRLLIDGIGALNWVGAWSTEFESSGIQLRVWNPVYSGSFVSGLVASIRKEGLSRFFINVNRRTHRKYVLIDSAVAFIGSQNISREHLPAFAGAKAWRDTGLRVSGDGIQNIEQAFQHAWDRSSTTEGVKSGLTWLERTRAPRLGIASTVRLNITRRMRFRFWRDLLKRIRKAQTSIWITTPYLSPTRLLLRSLVKARARGCDVKILLPSQSDVFFMRWIQTSYYDFLLKNNIEVYEYQPTFLHAKATLIDNWAMVGTTNMNTRSFLHDLEIDIVITGEAARAELRAQLLIDLSKARKIEPSDVAQKAWMSRLGRWVSFALRYWI